LSVASSLGINATRVSVTDVIAGSAILIVAIAPNNVTGSSSPAVPPTAAVAEMQLLASSLVTQAANPSSALVAQVAAQTGALVDTSFQPPPPAFAFTCWDGSLVHAQTACPVAAHSSASPSPDLEVKPLGAIVYVGAGAALLLGIVVLVYCWCRKRRLQLSYHQNADHTGTRFDGDVVDNGFPESDRDMKSVESGTDLLSRSSVASHGHAPNLEMQVRQRDGYCASNAARGQNFTYRAYFYSDCLSTGHLCACDRCLVALSAASSAGFIAARRNRR
jgi:hypothetical protein